MRQQQLRHLLALSFGFGLVVLASAASASAQNVVDGTGCPELDVPAVQAAVDQGGEVILRGHFSFDAEPTVPTALVGLATVLVSRAVAISGVQDEDGEMTSIEAGRIPFYVEAPGARVTIQRLTFVRPNRTAMFVYAVSGLVVASCRIEGVEPSDHTGTAIAINTSGGLPTPTNPGRPENVSGMLLILNNDIDVSGGTALDDKLGVNTFSVGVPGSEVDIFISGNNIRNNTEPAIGIRRIVGRAYIERNVVTTGPVVGQAPRPQAIRVVNTGSYLIAHNSIDCGWASAEAEGIGVFTQFVEWPMERAIVVDNNVTMSPPEGTVFTEFSAGIGVYGQANGNSVLNNRIRGQARAALYVASYQGGIPDNNAFVLNRFDDFEPSVADVFVADGVMNTLIVGPGTVEDHGIGTVIVPLK